MLFNCRYESKKYHFYIMVEKPEEFEILQPYFLATDREHTRKGRINRMDCPSSGSVWEGTCRHGYGYSVSADVYGTLIEIICELYKGKIVDGGALDNFLSRWNTHNERVEIPEEALQELKALNNAALEEKYNRM